MAQAMYNLSSHPELATLIAKDMRDAQYYGNLFTSILGLNWLRSTGQSNEVVGVGPGKMTKFIGAPIETVDTFIQEGRTDMLIPVVGRLTGDPVFGDKSLEGKEEQLPHGFRPVYVNRIRKAISVPTGMEKQKVKEFKRWLVDKAKPYLLQHFQDWYPGKGILSAFHFGYSHDLIAGTAFGGRNMTTISHPNMFIAGDDFVTYASGRPGTAGYEGEVESAIDGLTGAAGQTFSMALVQRLAFEAARKKIMPMAFSDEASFYILFAKDSQVWQLFQDPAYQAIANSLKPPTLLKHPLVNMAIAAIGNVLIVSDMKLWCARTNASDPNVTAGTVEYGPAPTAAERDLGLRVGNCITGLDAGNKACALLIGKSAATIATAEEISMKDNVKDYENVRGMGYDLIKSCIRNDIFDTLGLFGQTAGQFYENTGSIMSVSFSPQAIS